MTERQAPAHGRRPAPEWRQTRPAAASEAVAGGDGAHAAFELLHPAMKSWCWKQGWRSLRPVQTMAIPAIMRRNDHVLITAPTAGGKTEAAILPLVSRALLERQPGHGFELLYISPLKALINDQLERLESICDGSGMSVMPWHGEISQSRKQQARDAPEGVLLITPESLEAFLVHRYNALPRLFRRTSAVLIDEYHALLDNPRGMQTLSLISRIEEVTGRRIRRVGLSATIGDVGLAARQLSMDDPEAVRVVQPPGSGLTGEDGKPALEVSFKTVVQRRFGSRGQKAEADERIAGDLYERLRGANNLVFAESRVFVEAYAARLREMCESQRVPNEFWPHHGSLSGEDRRVLERRLKSGDPTTAICTSTLELGIDIGDIDTVCQIRPPYSVASLRQRLGRSGRRDTPARLRMYVREGEPGRASHPVDYLHLELVRGVAMLALLGEGWCEPARTSRLHLSTLAHQVLSNIAGRHGCNARRLYQSLCARGPFRNVDVDSFALLLRQLGTGQEPLIEQGADGRTLRLAAGGERMLQKRDFYATFKDTESYHVVTTEGQPLGALPLACPLTAGSAIVFSGRNWLVNRIDPDAHIVRLEPHTEGELPKFSGRAGDIHQRVIDEMLATLAGREEPEYLDDDALGLLAEARGAYRHLGLAERPVLEYARGKNLIATGLGSTGNESLKLLLERRGWKVYCWDGFIDAVDETRALRLPEALAEIGRSPDPDPSEALAGYENLSVDKYHDRLGPALLAYDLASSKLDLRAAAAAAGRLGAACGARR